jgi:hypothetical protein
MASSRATTAAGANPTASEALSRLGGRHRLVGRIRPVVTHLGCLEILDGIHAQVAAAARLRPDAH